jgi:hypothetical protein
MNEYKIEIEVEVIKKRTRIVTVYHNSLEEAQEQAMNAAKSKKGVRTATVINAKQIDNELINILTSNVDNKYLAELISTTNAQPLLASGRIISTIDELLNLWRDELKKRVDIWVELKDQYGECSEYTLREKNRITGYGQCIIEFQES